MIDQVRGCEGPGGPKLDVAILRCSGADGYNAPVLAMNGVNSVETFLGTSRAEFEDPAVAQAIGQAEVIFFAGGNQADYITFIKGTATDRALRAVLARGGGLGGTSAGAAIQGAIIHDATTGSSTTRQALADPFDPRIHFTEGWFGSPHLEGTLFETHLQRNGGYDRVGRLLAFVARSVIDNPARPVLGIGLPAGSSLVVDRAGLARVMGEAPVLVVKLDHAPEICKPRFPLTCREFKVWRILPGQTFDLAHRPQQGFQTLSVLGGAQTTDIP
jgi:cyanophycinase-like exopeptidase